MASPLFTNSSGPATYVRKERCQSDVGWQALSQVARLLRAAVQRADRQREHADYELLDAATEQHVALVLLRLYHLNHSAILVSGKMSRCCPPL